MSDHKVLITLDDPRGVNPEALITEETVPWGSGTVTHIMIGFNRTVTVDQLEYVLSAARHIERESPNVGCDT